VAEEFTCAVDEQYRSVCKDLPKYPGTRYCVLHYPGEEKNKEEFLKVVKSKLDRKHYNFGGTVFPEGTSDFKGREFDADANFVGATFKELAYFSNATFEEADFSRATFEGQAHFSNVTFKEADFSGATFERPATFALVHAATFKGEADFSWATFEGQASFNEAKFSGETTSFDEAQFGREYIDFSQAKFSGKATFFREAKFGGEHIDFSDATFNNAEQTSFSGAKFSGERTSFSGARFSSDYTAFERAVMKGNVYFNRTTFREKVEFLGTYSGRDSNLVFEPQAWVWFGAHIVKPELLTFHTVHLHPGWFINADVRKVDFTDVQWYGMPGGIEEGTLDEEIAFLKDRGGVESPHTLLAQACRRLSANAEENREYPLANEFHYWSMDAVRKGSWDHFKGLNLRGLLKKETWQDVREHFGLITTLYWALCGYGVRAARAFWILFAIWLMFAALYFLLIKSSPFWVFSAPDIWQGIDYARQAAVYSLSALVRLNPRPQTEALNWFQTLVTIEGILGPLQIALLVLAIRRKVMR
jgi:uncharacterized protein YjbI with pentapeptide repeats